MKKLIKIYFANCHITKSKKIMKLKYTITNTSAAQTDLQEMTYSSGGLWVNIVQNDVVATSDRAGNVLAI